VWGYAVGIGALVGAVLFTVRFLTADVRMKAALRKLQRSRVADAIDGEWVKLVGRVVSPETPLTSTSGQPCVYYHAWHEERRSDEKGGYAWVSVGEEEDACSFVIVDDSGRAFVEATTGKGLTGALRADAYRAVGDPAMGVRSREATVTDGQQIAVFGWATWEPDLPDATSGLYRDGAKRLVLRALDGAPIIVSDESKLLG